MKTPSLLTTLLASTSLLGCATEASDPECQPGDIECADDSASGGKGDAWDTQNDPRLLSTHLDYKLENLPRSGKLDKPVWASRVAYTEGENVMWSDTYWPTQRGSSNVRWQGAA